MSRVSPSVRYLLDTSVYSQRLRRKPDPQVIEQWKTLGDAPVATSTICEAELIFGLQKKKSKRLWLEYESYLRDKISLIPFERREAHAYAEIKDRLVSRGLPKGDLDIMIAATAKANGLIIATLNAKDFEVMEGVACEDWSRLQPDYLTTNPTERETSSNIPAIREISGLT
jgi:predicted nucleic acid-binding protein